MKIIGLTGGIGVGKSTVAEVFKLLKVPVYVSDIHAKKLMATNIDLQQKIIDLFGKESIIKNKIQTKFLAKKTFNNPELLKQLNVLVHPLVSDHFSRWLLEYSNCSYVIKEAAILFESGSNLSCDKVIVVSSDETTRINRVIKRDGVDRSDVKLRMSRQWPEKKKLELADFIIINDNKQSIIDQVVEIDRRLKMD